MIVTPFYQQSEKLKGSCNDLWPSKRRISFPETLFLKKFTVKQEMNKFVLMYEYFRFMYKFYLEGKPSPNSCFFLTSLNITREDRIWPAAVQLAITVIDSLLLPDVKIY